MLSCTQRLFSQRDQSSNVQGLASVIKFSVDAGGYGLISDKLVVGMVETVNQIRSDPQNFTRVPRGNGREAVACAMKAEEYVLL